MSRAALLRSAVTLLLLGWMDPSAAVGRITLHAETLQTGDTVAHDVEARFLVKSAESSVAILTIGRMELPTAITTQIGSVSNISLRCGDPIVSEPYFACPELKVMASATRLPPIAIDGSADVNSSTGYVDFKGTGPMIAGKPLRVELRGSAASAWQLRANVPQIDMVKLRQLVQPWLSLPKELAIAGNIDGTVELSGAREIGLANVWARVTDVNLQNADATVVAEKVTATLSATAGRIPGTGVRFESRLSGYAGQMLAGPVLLDFDRNLTDVGATGIYADGVVRLIGLTVGQRDLSQISGTAEVQLQPLVIRRAQLKLALLEFPAAYTSFMQIGLATTPFGALTTSGRASGAISIANNLPTQVDLDVKGLNLQDDSRQLQVTNVNSELHWSSGLTVPPRPSQLSWDSSRGWSIEGGPARIDFAAQDRDFRLLKGARLPFFDGAVLINTLEARNIGSDRLEGAFDAVIEPISMTRISKALSLPEFAGQLAGRVPGLTYKDGLLTVQGNVEAQVFDGRVVASNLKVRDPLGAWPRLYGDIVARNLDLDLITRTFEFGSITGRLDADVQGLETFNWSPVAFNFVLATPQGDESRHRISQKALKNLTSIGGGGGGVAAALQSGALRFFDEFRYDRLGLSCRLKNDVCQMNGVAPAANGFYIVKGSGIPRIDIIGNQNRVDWPLLMAQIAAAVANSGDIVVK